MASPRGAGSAHRGMQPQHRRRPRDPSHAKGSRSRPCRESRPRLQPDTGSHAAAAGSDTRANTNVGVGPAFRAGDRPARRQIRGPLLAAAVRACKHESQESSHVKGDQSCRCFAAIAATRWAGAGRLLLARSGHRRRPIGAIAFGIQTVGAARSLSHGFSCLAAAGGRLLRPGDAQAGSVVPAATAALLLLYGIGRSLAPRSDRPGSTVRVIAMREEQWPASWSRSPLLCHVGTCESALLLQRGAVVEKVPLPHSGGAGARRRCCSRGIAIARTAPRPTGKQSRGSCHDATTGVIEMSPKEWCDGSRRDYGSDRADRGSNTRAIRRTTRVLRGDVITPRGKTPGRCRAPRAVAGEHSRLGRPPASTSCAGEEIYSRVRGGERPVTGEVRRWSSGSLGCARSSDWDRWRLPSRSCSQLGAPPPWRPARAR